MSKYIINEERLIELLTNELKLTALESGGVDNWSWYGGSCQMFISDFIREELHEEMEDKFEDFSFRDIAIILKDKEFSQLIDVEVTSKYIEHAPLV